MLKRALVVLALVASGLAAVPADASVNTSAAVPTPAYDQPGCHSFYFLADKYEVNGGYRYTDTYTVPSASSCIDIWVTRVRTSSGCCSWVWAQYPAVRVRFYPSSGGSYTNSWQQYDWSPNPERSYPVATNVANGTRYRLEWYTNGGVLVDGRDSD